MLVCPNCRSENTEEAEVCRHCGNAMEAASSPLRRIDRSEEEEEPQLDLMPAKTSSAWPLVIVSLALGLGALGWGLYAALQPNPCEGKYSSALFSYCADIPEGWAGGLQPVGDTYEDRFVPVGDPEVEAQATVRVTDLVDTSVATQQYVQQFRTSQEANGLALSDVEPVMLDGEQAIAWGYSVQQGGEDTLVRVREVILVRPEGAWRVQLLASDETYEEARFAFEDLLASWRWKA